MYSLRSIARRKSTSRIVATGLLLGLLATTHALSAGITGVRWSGSDFVIGFTDSVGYSIDLGLSDSTQLVVRLTGIEPNDKLFRVGGNAGPNGAEALLSPTPDGGRLTITFPKRYGYSTVWRPYTHRLIVHTFDWDALSYGELQYYKGLLALEGGFVKQAEELLALAYATGEDRAGSVLGVHYARLGNDSLAGRYLHHAIDEDDRIAMRSIGREPNAIAATDDAQQPTEQASPAQEEESRQSPHPPTSGEFLTSLSDPRTIAAILVAVVTFAAIITVLFRRNSKNTARTRQQKLDEEERTIAEQARADRMKREEQKVARTTAPSPAATQPVGQTLPPQPTEVRAEEPQSVPPPPQPTERSVASPSVAPSTAPHEIEVTEAGKAVVTIETAGSGEPVQVAVRDTVEPQSAATTPTVEAPAAETKPQEKPATEPPPATAVVDKVAQTAAAPREAEQPQPRKTSTQAAELQRRIEAVRSGREETGEGGSTVSEARRLNVSRDNVELRRRMTELRNKIDQPADTWDKS